MKNFYEKIEKSKPIPKFPKGGVFNPKGIAIVGVKGRELTPMTKEEIRLSGLVNPIEFNTGKNSDI